MPPILGNTTTTGENAAAPLTGTELVRGVQSGGNVKMTTASIAALFSPTSAIGDLIVRGASADGRLAVGADGTSPVADSTQALGMRWDGPFAKSSDLASASNGMGGDLIGGVGRVVNTISALRALVKTGAGRSFVLGYYAAGDGGGGQYYYDSADTFSTDNGGTVIVASDGGRWKLANQQHVTNKQFGAKVDGVTDDTAANQAVLTNCRNVVFVAGTTIVSAALTVPSHTTVSLQAGAVVSTATADISLMDMAGQTGSQVYGPGKLLMTATGTVGNVGGVNMTGATDCLCFGVEIVGYQWAGVLMKAATRCHALRNNIHDSVGTLQDAAAVTIYGNCRDCSVDSNEIKNSGYHGVLVQGYGNGTIPLNTRVTNNNIDGATSYGVISYQIDAANTATLIEGNTIQNISGTTTSGSSGAGIYIQSAGGVHVLANRIHNVCTATTNNTLTPGGIGVNNIRTVSTSFTGGISGTVLTVSAAAASSVLIGMQVGGAAAGTIIVSQGTGLGATGTYNVNISQTVTAGTVFSGSLALVPPTIDTNTIWDVGIDANGAFNPNTVNLSGINISSSPSGANLGPNTILQQRAGLPLANYIGLWINASSNVTGQMPNVQVSPAQALANGVFIYANGKSISNISLSGGAIVGGDYAGIRVDQNGGFTVAGLSLLGTVVNGGSSGCIPLRLTSVADGVVIANCSATTVAALAVSSCTQLRINGGRYVTTGATAVSTAGVCTGSSIDKSAYWGASASLMSNAATGFSVEWRSNAAPAAGTWAVGDRTINYPPVVGSPKAWDCTTAGAPGVQTSEGNL